jgi:hypothetical protein
MNLLLSEEATNFKARSIALASTLKIELADGSDKVYQLLVHGRWFSPVPF